MTTAFPSGLDSFAPVPTNQQTVVRHRARHQNIEDSVEAIEAKVGINGSADTNSLDYKIGQLNASGGSAQVGFIQSGSGSTARTVQAKLRERLSAQDKGVIGGSGADVTTALNTLLTQGGSESRIVELGEGVFLVSSLVGQDNVTLVGQGAGRTIIRRINNTAGNVATLDFQGKSGFTISGITVDGNKANQVNGAQAASMFNCFNYTITDCVFTNAKAVSGSFGEGLVIADGANSVNNTACTVRGCKFTNNDGNGFLVVKEFNIAISDCFASGNTGNGIILQNLVFPPTANAQDNVTISGNICQNNGGNGIGVKGYYTGGSLSAPIYGPDTASSFITISGNVCKFNGIYGIAFQGSFGAVTGNTCSNNSGTGFGAGILFNCQASTCTGNTTFGNEVYGYDCGGSFYCTITGNTSYADGDVGINCGASVGCVFSSNVVVLSGSDSDIGITMPGLDGDGTSPFPVVGAGSQIVNNTIYLNSNSSSFGIYVSRDYQNAVVKNNRVYGASNFNQGYIFQTQLVIAEGNEDDYFPRVVGTVIGSVASAATTVVPDAIRRSYVSGTTNITAVRTFSQDAFFEKVLDIRMTSQGTGYSRTTPPTLSITGGGGAGATATAEIDNGGRFVGVTMTSPGSGYTSTPTVNITHNGGSGAVALALVGCNNADGQELTLLFQGVLTVMDGAGLDLVSNFTTAANISNLKLIGSFGGWYEVSRRA